MKRSLDGDDAHELIFRSAGPILPHHPSVVAQRWPEYIGSRGSTSTHCHCGPVPIAAGLRQGECLRRWPASPRSLNLSRSRLRPGWRARLCLEPHQRPLARSGRGGRQCHLVARRTRRARDHLRRGLRGKKLPREPAGPARQEAWSSLCALPTWAAGNRPPAPRCASTVPLDAIQQRIAARAWIEPRASGEPGTRKGFVDRVADGALNRWARDETAPHAPVNADVLVDGCRLVRVIANRYCDGLRAAGLGSGFCSFSVAVPADVKRDRIEVRRAVGGSLLMRSDADLAQVAAQAKTAPRSKRREPRGSYTAPEEVWAPAHLAVCRRTFRRRRGVRRDASAEAHRTIIIEEAFSPTRDCPRGEGVMLLEVRSGSWCQCVGRVDRPKSASSPRQIPIGSETQEPGSACGPQGGIWPATPLSPSRPAVMLRGIVMTGHRSPMLHG